MATAPYRWHRQTIAETFERICGRNGTTPWVAIGDFLDDWRRSAVEDRNGRVALLARWVAIPPMDKARELQVARAVVSLQGMALARVAISNNANPFQDA